MLRRKFLLVLGGMVAMLLAMAITAILLLHGVLAELDSASMSANASNEAILRLRTRFAEARNNPADAAIRYALQKDLDAFTLPVGVRQPDVVAALTRLRAILDDVSAPDADTAAVFPALRDELDQLAAVAVARIEDRRQRATARFRGVAFMVGLLFVVLINVSVVVLSRMVSMVVKPVDKLVEASRRLAREEFDHRVELDRTDEFAELARAYNALARQLQANEQRKVETLHQVAATLNHELNNAIGIIELQLALVGRASRGDGAQAERLHEIHRTLARISGTVHNLTRVRRIVLTDYSAGVRMLDLEQSLVNEPSEDISEPGRAAAGAINES